MSHSPAHRDRFSVFAHLNADKAALYRAILSVFTEAKSRFAIHLRPEEVLVRIEMLEPELLLAAAAGGAGLERVEAALRQLCEWGNVEAHPDTTDVATVEDFYRPRYLYQLTPAGEAAERSIALYEEALSQKGELQTAALNDLLEILGELQVLAESPELDPGKVHRTLISLRTRFEELTSRAQSFISSLQRTIDLQGIDVSSFLNYKDKLIEYLERFIGELVLMTAEIASRLRKVEAAGIERLLEAAASRDLVDALNPSQEDYASARALWHGRWLGLRAWFIRSREASSQAEVLRAHARSAIPALLGAVSNINDRRTTRSDRVSDLLTLARWFAEADTPADAHRLWRAAFALSPARHLRIDEETLEARDQAPVSSRTSWLDAPPLLISPRLRKTGRYTRRGNPMGVIDRTREKRFLEEAARMEAEQIVAAQRRLANARRMRLSEIGSLNPMELQLFLDLLGEALARKIHPEEIVEASSSDGSLSVVLEPTGDEASAVIETSWGKFSGLDHFITVRDAFALAQADNVRPLATADAPAEAAAGAPAECAP